MEDFDIKAWRDRMGYSQGKAAEVLHANFFTLRNWDQGLIAVPGPVAELCRRIETDKAIEEARAK